MSFLLCDFCELNKSDGSVGQVSCYAAITIKTCSLLVTKSPKVVRCVYSLVLCSNACTSRLIVCSCSKKANILKISLTVFHLIRLLYTL